jgi:hypothetical protein
MKLEGKTYKQGYNAQVSVCGENGLITASDVTNEANDKKQLSNMLERIEENTPEKIKQNFRNGKHLADSGYYTTDNLIFSEENGFDIYIPKGTTKELFRSEEKKSSGKNIGIKDCEIIKNSEEITVICPGNIELTDYTNKKNRGEEYYCFAVNKGEIKCKECALFKKCSSNLKDKKQFRIKKKIIENWEIIEKNRRKIECDQGRRIYSKRISLIEKVFGHIKNNLGIRQFLVCSLEKTKTVWNLICVTYNLQRMFNLQMKTTV